MTTRPEVVAVAGASGYIGSRLLKELEDAPNRPHLVAIDTRPLAAPIHQIAAYRRNLTQPIDDILRQRRVNTLVHLAFITRRGRTRAEVSEIRQANVGALRSVLDACARNRVGHVIYLSSHTVYGAHRDNPVPITERAPQRPNTDFPYAQDKHFCERLLAEFKEQRPDIKVTALRCCIVVGPYADNDVTRAFFRPWLLAIRGWDPPFQFVHEDDLAKALTIIIQEGIEGVFNVAADGVVFYSEVAALAGSRLLELPAPLAYFVTQMSWQLGIQKEATASGLDLARYPITLATGKLRQATGYRFAYTSVEALNSFLTAHK